MLKQDIISTYRETISKGQYQFSVLGKITDEKVLVTVTSSDLLEYSERKFMTTLSLKSRVVEPILIPMEKKLKGICTGLTSSHFRFVDSEKKAGEKSVDKVICEEWVNGFEQSRTEIPDVKDVYVNNNVIGNPKSDEQGNMYFICEASEKTYPRGYFDPTNESSASINDKFRLTPDFGETMLKTRGTVLMKFSSDTKSFSKIAFGSNTISPLFVCPLPSSSSEILITGLDRPNQLFTPGLSRCFNRETKLFSLIDGKLSLLSPNMYMALAPIVSPNGKTVAFIGSEDRFDTHCTELDIFILEKSSGWSTPTKLIIPRKRDDSSFNPTFNGIFLSAQAESELMTFLPDNQTVVVPSFANGRSGIFLIDIRNSTQNPISLFPPTEAGKLSSVVLLRVIGTNILFTHSGYTCQRSLWVAKINSLDNIEYSQLLSSPRLDEKFCAGFHSAKISVIQGNRCPAWLLQSGCNDGRSQSGRPLIAYFHGGPFMGAISSFSVEMAAFLSQGYDVVIPNYRGSFSYGREFLHELESFVGIKDVEDCHDCVEIAKDIVKPSLVIAYGGSHGGFLTGWLLGHPEYQGTYAGGVLWNPAVDLISSNLTSDIPDWAVNVVMGKVEDPMERFAPSIDFITKAYRQSPMSVVKNVKVPSLVLLGSNDRRVVPCAGLRWAQAVKENGGDVDVHWYPDQGHAIAGPEFYETAIVTIGLWINNKFT